jgi:hypothetical protein
MNSATRNAILRGVACAAETHDAFHFREKHEDGSSAIDVFALIHELQIPLEFRPLDGLLGACIRINSAEVGILITTQRDLHMQRFTAAHELGHFVLEHQDSLDPEVRMPGHTEDRDPREIEADAFAAEFLMPKWLVRSAAERRGWWSEDGLRTPEIVYQLSLRLATSYEATCWGLASHGFVDQVAARALVERGKQPKEAKRRVLQGIPLDDSWADVWHLGASDDGGRIDAGPTDVATGFRWDPRDVIDMGFALLDDSSNFDDSIVGGPSRRRLVLRAPPPGSYNLHLPLRRSFAKAPISTWFHLSISTVGARRSADPAAGTPTAPTSP